jgi:hypothetical protein
MALRSCFNERNPYVKNKMIIAAVAASAIAATSGGAVAGIKSYMSTSISKATDGSGTVSGIFSSARDSSDNTEQFGCYINTAKGSSAPTAYLFASTTAQGYAQCYTSDPQLLSAIHGLTDDTAVLFMFDTHGECTYVWTGFSSMWAHKAP